MTVRGQIIPLTVKEFDIFSLLIQHPRRVYSYENLRRKMKVAPDVPDYVNSVYGIGYQFET